MQYFVLTHMFFLLNVFLNDGSGKEEVGVSLNESSIISGANQRVKSNTLLDSLSYPHDMRIYLDLYRKYLSYNKDEIVIKYDFISVEGSNVLLFKGSAIDTLPAKEVMEFINDSWESTIEVYKYYTGKDSVLLFSSGIVRSTGLAASYSQWQILFYTDKDGHMASYRALTLCQSPKSFFKSQESDHFLFVEFDYSDDFFFRKDYDNMTYNVKIKVFDVDTSYIKEERRACCLRQ